MINFHKDIIETFKDLDTYSEKIHFLYALQDKGDVKFYNNITKLIFYINEFEDNTDKEAYILSKLLKGMSFEVSLRMYKN